MRATNAKLRSRAARLVAIATGEEIGDAEAALAAAGGDARVAIASLLLGTPPAAARELLAAAGGDLRRTLGQRR
jgi:N-acetylmuramic acid 6-phosphate etherase